MLYLLSDDRFEYSWCIKNIQLVNSFPRGSSSWSAYTSRYCYTVQDLKCLEFSSCQGFKMTRKHTGTPYLTTQSKQKTGKCETLQLEAADVALVVLGFNYDRTLITICNIGFLRNLTLTMWVGNVLGLQVKGHNICVHTCECCSELASMPRHQQFWQPTHIVNFSQWVTRFHEWLCALTHSPKRPSY